MTDVASSLTRTVARQYDLFQASLESLQKDRKFLNYGYRKTPTCRFSRVRGTSKKRDDRADPSVVI